MSAIFFNSWAKIRGSVKLRWLLSLILPASKGFAHELPQKNVRKLTLWVLIWNPAAFCQRIGLVWSDQSLSIDHGIVEDFRSPTIIMKRRQGSKVRRTRKYFISKKFRQFEVSQNKVKIFWRCRRKIREFKTRQKRWSKRGQIVRGQTKSGLSVVKLLVSSKIFAIRWRMKPKMWNQDPRLAGGGNL